MFFGIPWSEWGAFALQAIGATALFVLAVVGAFALLSYARFRHWMGSDDRWPSTRGPQL